MLRLALIFGVFGLTQCDADETVSAYGAADQVWVLTELDGVTFSARATLTFPETGKIAGEGPCNRYSGVMTTPYPWFDAGQVVSTRMACPDLAAESAFFASLSGATQSEVAGDILILRNDAGDEMVFKASD